MSEQTGKAWYESKPGNSSAMRIIAMIGAAVGALTMIVGSGVMIAAVFALFHEIPEAVQLAMQAVAFTAIGGGMIGVGEIAKWAQAKGEK